MIFNDLSIFKLLDILNLFNFFFLVYKYFLYNNYVNGLCNINSVYLRKFYLI